MAIEDTWEGEIYKDIRTEVERLAAIQTAVEKIPDAWSGTAYSKNVTTPSTTVERCESVETRIKHVQFMNRNYASDLTYSAVVGLYNSNAATFRSNGYILFPSRTISFDNIDLYTLGYASLYDTKTVPLMSAGTRE